MSVSYNGSCYHIDFVDITISSELLEDKINTGIERLETLCENIVFFEKEINEALLNDVSVNLSVGLQENAMVQSFSENINNNYSGDEKNELIDKLEKITRDIDRYKGLLSDLVESMEEERRFYEERIEELRTTTYTENNGEITIYNYPQWGFIN